MYEYQFISLASPNVEAKTAALKQYTDQHWQVESINDDFTVALLRRECEPTVWKLPEPRDAIPVPQHIRDTDSFPVVEVVGKTIAIEFDVSAPQIPGTPRFAERDRIEREADARRKEG